MPVKENGNGCNYPACGVLFITSFGLIGAHQGYSRLVKGEENWAYTLRPQVEAYPLSNRETCWACGPRVVVPPFN